MTAYLADYLAAGFALLGWIALCDRHEVREAFWLCLLWPLTLAVILVAVAVGGSVRLVGWRIDLNNPPRSLSGWGWRRPQDGWPGFAVRCPWGELQVWKAR